jgi:hypothetical protein
MSHYPLDVYTGTTTNAEVGEVRLSWPENQPADQPVMSGGVHF